MVESAPVANFSLKINSDNKSYDLQFSIKSDKLDISISNNSSISLSFNAAFTFDELLKLNRYFRQFDTVLEIYNFIVNLENIEELIDIKVENKFINLKICIPSISDNNANNEIIFVLPAVQIKESELIVKLCQEVEKINILEKKINYIFLCIGKTEEDFKTYEEAYEKLPQTLKHLSTVMESKIVTPVDFATVQIGIKEKLNKTIKGAKLLYRASRDGDNSTQFHSKCDGIENTVTFVKAKNGRKFGGFANKAFNSSNQYISDPNCFVFSLLHKECYYYNNSGNMIYGGSDRGPAWGDGHDLYLASGCLNKNSGTNQSSFDYKGKSNALSGGTSFQAEDYETYQLILE